MAYDHILTEKEDGVAIITLNRPEAMNSLNEGIRREIHAALDEAAADPEIRAIVLTGAGRAFSAGADMSGGVGGGGRPAWNTPKHGSGGDLG